MASASNDIFVTNEIQHKTFVNHGRRDPAVNRNSQRRIAPASVVVAKPEDSDDERELQQAFKTQLREKMQEQYDFEGSEEASNSGEESGDNHGHHESTASEYTEDTDSENDVAYERFYGENNATYSDEDEAGEDDKIVDVEMAPINPLVRSGKSATALHSYSKSQIAHVSYDLGQSSKPDRITWLFQAPVTATCLRYRSQIGRAHV